MITPSYYADEGDVLTFPNANLEYFIKVETPDGDPEEIFLSNGKVPGTGKSYRTNKQTAIATHNSGHVLLQAEFSGMTCINDGLMAAKEQKKYWMTQFPPDKNVLIKWFGGLPTGVSFDDRTLAFIAVHNSLGRREKYSIVELGDVDVARQSALDARRAWDEEANQSSGGSSRKKKKPVASVKVSTRPRRTPRSTTRLSQLEVLNSPPSLTSPHAVPPSDSSYDVPESDIRRPVKRRKQAGRNHPSVSDSVSMPLETSNEDEGHNPTRSPSLLETSLENDQHGAQTTEDQGLNRKPIQLRVDAKTALSASPGSSLRIKLSRPLIEEKQSTADVESTKSPVVKRPPLKKEFDYPPWVLRFGEESYEYYEYSYTPNEGVSDEETNNPGERDRQER